MTSRRELDRIIRELSRRSVIGSVIFVLAQGYLQDLLRIASGLAKGIPFLPALLSPDRWLLWLGLMFVLAVYFFPQGIVGRLREKKAAPDK